MTASLRIAHVSKECVACGCCARVCPRAAIQIAWGISACVDPELCVGCRKCAQVCPAAVIDIVEREAVL